MPKFCVVSYDHDEQQSFWDFIEASDSEKAGEMVEKARDYILAVTDVMTADELRDIAGRLEGFADLPDSAWALAKSLDAAENFCSECGADNDDGEGWDGLCGNCADRKEANV